MQTGETDDFSGLDDPAFLAERARVRAELQYEGDTVNRAALQRVFDAMTAEFLHRARIAWATTS